MISTRTIDVGPLGATCPQRCSLTARATFHFRCMSKGARRTRCELDVHARRGHNGTILSADLVVSDPPRKDDNGARAMTQAQTLFPIGLVASALVGCADPCLDDGLGQDAGNSVRCAAVASLSGTDGGSGAATETGDSNTAGETGGGGCDNGVRDGDETDVDCGGSCAAGCGSGQGCGGNTDCDSNSCDGEQKTCEGDGACDDGVQNQDETDLDCGGACGATCETGETCNDNGDCISAICGDEGTCDQSSFWCEDTDADGFGDPKACTAVPTGGTPPAGTVNNSDDCDDGSPFAFPGAAPNDSATACMEDKDGDDWGDDDPGSPNTTPGTDCDDDSATTFPGAAPNDSLEACMQDADGDGWGDAMPPGGVMPGADCEDGDVAVPPGCMSLLVTAAPQNILLGDDSTLLATPVLGQAPYTFAWDAAGSLSDTAIAGPIATPVQSTTYNVTATDNLAEQASGDITVHVTDVPLDLSQCVEADFGINLSNPNPNWVYSGGNTQACETANADPSALICNVVLSDASFTANFAINTSDDDDQIGFVWGWQDSQHFYLFTWKQLPQNFGSCDVDVPQGMVIKVVDAAGALQCEDLLDDVDTPNATLLATPASLYDQGWLDDTDYIFELEHEPTQFTLTVRLASDLSIVVQTTIVDSTYPSGRFGPYAYSQDESCFADIFTQAN